MLLGLCRLQSSKLPKTSLFSMLFPGVLKTTVKTSDSIKARLESENKIRFRFAAFQASNNQTVAVI